MCINSHFYSYADVYRENPIDYTERRKTYKPTWKIVYNFKTFMPSGMFLYGNIQYYYVVQCNNICYSVKKIIKYSKGMQQHNYILFRLK